MDPALALITDTVTSNLVHSLTYARAVFGPIGDLYVAYNYRIGAAELEAFEALRRTVVDVKDDIKFFKTMISALESTEDQLFLQRFAISRCPLTVSIWGGVTNILSQE